MGGDQRACSGRWRPQLKGRGGSQPEKSGKGARGDEGPRPTPPSLPAARLPHLGGAACQRRPHVCATGGEGANWRRAPRPGSRKGLGAPQAAGRLTRGLRGRRRGPAGPARLACAAAAKADQPRPGRGRRRGQGRRADQGADSRGRRARFASACFRTTLSGLSRFPRAGRTVAAPPRPPPLR